MSGSGSSGGFGSGGTGGRGVDCENFSFETHIHSPNPNELPNLSVGIELNVTVAMVDGYEVVQLMLNGRVVGGIVDQGDRVKQCISHGFNFVAKVRKISGALVKIFVQSVDV